MVGKYSYCFHPYPPVTVPQWLVLRGTYGHEEWEAKYQYSAALRVIVFLCFLLRILVLDFSQGFCTFAFAWNNWNYSIFPQKTETIPLQTCHSKHALIGFFENTQDSYGIHQSTLASVFTHCTFVLITSTCIMHDTGTVCQKLECSTRLEAEALRVLTW